MCSGTTFESEEGKYKEAKERKKKQNTHRENFFDKLYMNERDSLCLTTEVKTKTQVVCGESENDEGYR
jgi:hypothetical protein